MKEELKRKAIALRKRGYSLNKIVNELGISKSTASNWLRDIKLSAGAKMKIGDFTEKARMKAMATNRAKKVDRINKIDKAARLEVAQVRLSKSQQKLLCSMIYYCEGAKDDGAVYFTNSDPELLKLFLRLLRSIFKLDESKFRVIVHIHEYHNWNKQRQYWAKLLKISEQQFFKPYIKAHTGKNQKLGYPGCVSLRYYDSNISRELLAFSKAYFNK